MGRPSGNHMMMYAGNGQVIHAKGEKYGTVYEHWPIPATGRQGRYIFSGLILNLLDESADDSSDDAYFADERERTRMKAEAKVWRAWYHIRLLNWYGRNDGIPIVEESLLPADIYKSRNTVDELP
mgnify:CR=1 FL=1